MSKENEIPIIVEHKQFKVAPGTITGAAIRALTNPPIGPDRDLWLEVPGGDDIKVADADTISVKPGMHFYSAPSSINPGAQ